MEVLDQVISILSGTFGIGAGIFALRTRTKARAIPSPASPRAEVTSYSDDSALVRPRQPEALRPALLVGSLALLIPVPFAVAARHPVVALAWLFLSGTYLYLAQSAARPHSSTRKSASLSLRVPKQVLMQRSHEVLKRIGLRILNFDVDAGLIEARRGPNLRTFGERVTVVISEGGPDESMVGIESDTLWTTTAFDLGANQRNVDRFVEGLTGYGR